MTEKLAVLGSTGSVGGQALDVCRNLGIKVTALSAGSNIKKLEEQIREFSPLICAVADETEAKNLKLSVADTGVKIISGKNAAEELAGVADCDTVLNSVSGIAGLRPTLAAAESKKNIALANKESLVTFGEGVTRAVKENKVMLLPVDSEHSAIFQCLIGKEVHGQRIKRLILTASGGPFFGKSGEELKDIKPSDALAHPTWNMGSRITIDSATMMNKGFEVIEAVWLFGVEPESVDVVVHRESIIHSMVEYIDSTVIAQLAPPDMRLCAQYALTYPTRSEGPVSSLDFAKIGSLSFYKPDMKAFPLLSLAYDAIKAGGVKPAAMNGADEEAVSLFLSGKIGFTDIFKLVTEATNSAAEIDTPTLSDVERADIEARHKVRELADALNAVKNVSK